MSNPYNGTMLKMFNLVDIGECAESCIPNIFRVWREQGWKEPVIVELSKPGRIISLSLLKKESSNKNGDKGAKIDMLGVKGLRARRILSKIIVDRTIVVKGSNRNRIYKPKA